MKLKTIVASTISVLTIGLASVTSAYADIYYPPERIHCWINNHKLTCEGFNHQFFAEDTYTADLTSKDQLFSFKSAVAYFTPDQSQVSVFVTYHDSHHKMVKLKSTSTHIRPDLNNGQWTKMDEDLYLCRGGYMHCPVTTSADMKK